MSDSIFNTNRLNRLMPRRQFLRTVGTFGAAMTGLRWAGESPAWAEDVEAPKIVSGKDPRLIIMGDRPIVLQTPTQLLAENSVTPVEQLFVRNCQLANDALDLQGRSVNGWTLAIDGLVNREVTIDASQLQDLEQVEREMVLQCSGNSRSLYTKTVPVSGTQWGHGGMGNVRFAGVPLRLVLERLGVNVDPAARFVTAEGRDTALPGTDDFAHSLPLDDVLERSILALHLNGRPLPAIHGGPLRLITPGVYATMNVKWLHHLRFDKQETHNFYQMPQYRVPLEPIRPGAKFEYTFTNSRPNWGMKVKSVILSPATGGSFPGNSVNVTGVAFNDGSAPIDSVLISVDDGHTWRAAELKRPASPYAWTTFELNLRLKPGRYGIWSRAVDALGRSQPIDGSIFWNPHGYEWNGVDRVEVSVG